MSNIETININLNGKNVNDSQGNAIRHQFECYYIGKDGHTVRHRQQWLYRFSYVFPDTKMPNNPPTPLWLEPINTVSIR